MTRKVRVVMAKLGLDIHWRGVYLVAQFLKDAGMEVVFLGNQFPEQIVEAALEEDADIVGLSTLSGNHMTLGPKVVRLLRRRAWSSVKVYMGGVMAPERCRRARSAHTASTRSSYPTPPWRPSSTTCTRASGGHAISPEDDRGREADLPTLDRALPAGRQAGDRAPHFPHRARGPGCARSWSASTPTPAARTIIGITGPPGSGKSTLVDRLVKRFCDDKRSVGVIAVDPSSPFSGGALLGDRVRMNKRQKDWDVFFRSMSAGSVMGGLARTTKEASRVLDASGKQIIIIETVGVGQSELDIAKATDTVLVVLTRKGATRSSS